MAPIYLKTAFRNVWKKKSYSALNIFGLAVGIATAALIFLWVEDELTFDSSFGNRSNIYRVMENESFNGVPNTSWVTPGPMAEAVKADIPGIKNATRLTGWTSNSLFSIGDKALYEKGAYVDSSFFSIFNIRFIRGDRRHAFDQLHSIVITERMAVKFFDQADPLGQILKMDNGDLYTVMGVIPAFPANSSFTFEWAAPFELLYPRYDWMSQWDANGVGTIVELEPGADRSQVDRQISEYVKTRSKSESTYFLFPMTDWHLYAHFSNGRPDGDGQIKYVKLFSLIASLILVIACVNFMNLATARSEQRAREVGVRKTMGAGRRLLIRQFIGEAITLSMIAVTISIACIYLALPAFNTLVGKNLVLRLTDLLHVGGLLSIGVVSGLLAGSYPAFYLSSFDPAQVLKGLKATRAVGATFIRKGLVVGQFAVSITLIICTAIIYQQVQHAKNRDLGYDRDNIIYVNLRGDMQSHFDALKTAFLNSGAVENAALSMNPSHGLGWFSSDNYTWQGKDPDKDVLITVDGVSPEFIATTGRKIKAGRDFYPVAANDMNNVIINETLAGLMGSGNPIGAEIIQPSRTPGNEWKMRVIGVVEDFVFENIYGAGTQPIILTCNPDRYSYLTIRLREDGEVREQLSVVESLIRTHFPEYPFVYNFLDDEFNKLFKTESLIEKLAGTFAGLAIAISCLGLFGLAAYTAARRTKEISIRKVLGASVSGITGLLSRDFLQLVAISCIISFPASWWFMTEWLSSYEYRTPVHWWVFAMAGAGALLIALLTVSFQTIKAALVNPASSLRRE